MYSFFRDLYVNMSQPVAIDSSLNISAIVTIEQIRWARCFLNVDIVVRLCNCNQ